MKWTPLVPRTAVGGHAANGFAVSVEQRFTHLRVNQHPDGGIARLRVYGEVVPDPKWLDALGTFDVVALENGGQAEDASNLFYSPATNTIQPGRSRKMDDGWDAAAATRATTGSATGSSPSRRSARSRSTPRT
ncbi:allantoicase [Streptomyces glaucescens]